MAHMRTTAILKTDIVDSTPRTAQLTQSEMGFQRRQHKRFISDITARHEGTIFQEEGDAYWIKFPSVTTAVLAAIEMHQSLRATQIGRGNKQRLAIRAVVSVGDILYQENDTIGTALSLTARIEKITPPDEIYLSHAAWLVMNKGEVQSSFVDEFALKGFPEPEKVYKVDQKYRTRVLTEQYIVYTDARGFNQFIKSNGPEQVEGFLIACDDVLNEICDKYNGVIRQVVGDEYFLTFSEPSQVLPAIRELCDRWNYIIQHFGIGISIGIHKGSLHIIRSFVHGDDIHNTVVLSGFSRFYVSRLSEIWVVTSRNTMEELKCFLQEEEWQELDGSQLTEETDRKFYQLYGAYRLLSKR